MQPPKECASHSPGLGCHPGRQSWLCRIVLHSNQAAADLLQVTPRDARDAFFCPSPADDNMSCYVVAGTEEHEGVASVDTGAESRDGHALMKPDGLHNS